MQRKILLINLGGPRTSDEIEKFLLDLFRDPLVFDLPLPENFRYKLGSFIAKKRAPKVRKVYEMLHFGGGSPLVQETEKQAKALVDSLKSSTLEEWEGRVAMTCGFPDLREFSRDELSPSSSNVILPLFPHYSRSTTLSTAKIIESITGKSPLNKKGWINPFSHRNKYVLACKQIIKDYFEGKLQTEFLSPDRDLSLPVENWKTITLLFSAHGIPMRLIQKGDTYKRDIEEHANRILFQLRQEGFLGEVFLSFQSRVGPAKWTEPSTIDTLKNLGSKGHKRVAVVPISFVSDHLETLIEIGEELKELALKNGVKEYYRIPAFGIYPPFIEFLKELILENIKEGE
ncbi:MAG: ferrochelatase [Leptospiraceae bacterium]|nr:ferrochelatase [Leptospiraceae bacterium]MCP5502279.1 ferrochelatase [Leptospiraceae bacterium]